MTNKLTFDTAFNELQNLVQQIENDDIKLDTLAAKVDEANRLIGFCENELRNIQADVLKKQDG